MSCECNNINIQGLKCSINPIGKNWKQMILNEKVTVPKGLPDIVNITSVKLSLKINGSNLIQTPDSMDTPNAEGTYLTGLKLIVNGEVNQTISYNSGEACKVYSFNNSEPFSTFIVLDPGYDVYKPICLDGCIDGALVKQIGCRDIQKNIAIFVYLK